MNCFYLTCSLSNAIFRTQDAWNNYYSIFVATSTSLQCILDHHRSIALQGHTQDRELFDNAFKSEFSEPGGVITLPVSPGLDATTPRAPAEPAPPAPPAEPAPPAKWLLFERVRLSAAALRQLSRKPEGSCSSQEQPWSTGDVLSCPSMFLKEKISYWHIPVCILLY